MKLTKTNRMVNGNELVIRHPITGKEMEMPIDTDTETPFATKHFNRMINSGDLQVVGITKTKKQKELTND